MTDDLARASDSLPVDVDPEAVLAEARDVLSRVRAGFVAVAFVVATVVLGLVLRFVQDRTGLGGDQFRLAALAPLLGALAVSPVMRDRRQMLGLLPVAVSRAQTRAHTILGLGAVVVVAVLVLVGLALTGRPVGSDLGGLGPTLLVLGPILLAGSLAQEVGWRGVLQPMLERLWSRPVAVAVTSAAFGAWAVWALEVPGALLAPAAVAVLALSVLLGYLGNGSVSQRLVTVVPAHWLVAVVLALLVGERLLERDLLVVVALVLAATAAAFLAAFVKARRARARARS